MVKQRAFQDPDINLEIKTDLRNAAIGSILRYGVTTLTTRKKPTKQYNVSQLNAYAEFSCANLMQRPTHLLNTKLKTPKGEKRAESPHNAPRYRKKSSVTYTDGKQRWRKHT